MKKVNHAYETGSDLETNDSAMDSQDNRYLTFAVGKESYALNIRDIIEILGIQEITKVPDLPESVVGVINLRDNVIPVMDIRTRFRMEPKPYDDRTCVIVTDVNQDNMGLIVDTVNEVVDIPPDLIDPPPRATVGKSGNYVFGLGRLGSEVKIVLDIDKVLQP